MTINVADALAVSSALAENGIELSVDDTTSDKVLFGTVSIPTATPSRSSNHALEVARLEQDHQVLHLRFRSAILS